MGDFVTMMSRRFAVLLATLSATVAAASSLPPVVIIPGDGSNQIEAKLDKKTAPHFYCSKKEDWFRLWLNLEILVPGVLDCWCDNIRLVVDNVTGMAENARWSPDTSSLLGHHHR